MSGPLAVKCGCHLHPKEGLNRPLFHRGLVVPHFGGSFGIYGRVHPDRTPIPATMPMVTGPSMTRDTSIITPKRPVATSIPSLCNAATTSSTKRSAGSGRAT